MQDKYNAVFFLKYLSFGADWYFYFHLWNTVMSGNTNPRLRLQDILRIKQWLPSIICHCVIAIIVTIVMPVWRVILPSLRRIVRSSEMINCDTWRNNTHTWRKNKENRPLTAVKLQPNMSEEMFQQGSAPAYTASKIQQCRANVFDI